MKIAKARFTSDFTVIIDHARAQAAEMVIAPGDKEGGPGNRHHGADQWLYVVSGNGTAIVNGESIGLEPGSLVLIERGETHEIRCGDREMKTLNFYLPPAYGADGEELPAGRPD